MERKRVIVYETKDVNELAIENIADDVDVFVQSGDIVKGGQQDRVLAVDLILPPRSGRIAISAFCVEAGRWSRRGSETATRFETSSERIASRELKNATAVTNSQTQVWSEVVNVQNKISRNIGASVNAQTSESSLQLSLENKRLQQMREAYVKKLTKTVRANRTSSVTLSRSTGRSTAQMSMRQASFSASSGQSFCARLPWRPSPSCKRVRSSRRSRRRLSRAFSGKPNVGAHLSAA